MDKLNSGVKIIGNIIKQFHDKMKSVYLIFQKSDESNDDWIKRFRTAWNVAVLVSNGRVFMPKVLPGDAVYGAMTKEELLEASKAMFRFLYSDRGRYGNLQRDIKKNLDLGLDSYPLNMEELYRLLTNK